MLCSDKTGKHTCIDEAFDSNFSASMMCEHNDNI